MGIKFSAKIYFSIFMEINTALGDYQNPLEQLEKIFIAIKKIIHFDIASFFAIKKGNIPELIFKQGEPNTIVESVNFRLGKGGTLLSVINQKPYIVKNKIKKDEKVLSSFIAIPIIFQKKAIGVISLGNYNNYYYQKLEIMTLRIISSALTNLLIFLNSYADNNSR